MHRASDDLYPAARAAPKACSATQEFGMDPLWSILSSIPWYGWVAIIAIVCGTIVKLAARSDEPSHACDQ
jgi:hypothetical protein